MPVKQISANGKTYKFGRNPAIATGPTFKIKNYMLASLPLPPMQVNYASGAQPALGEMYLNDILGNCVIACMGHVGGVFLGNAGGKLYLTPAQITTLYSAIGGYVPGDPSTDNGCDIPTALNYWTQVGLLKGNTPPHKIKMSMAVDATNKQEVQTAIWLFENLITGVNLPDKWVSSMPSVNGWTWDVAGNPDPNNGHCFPCIGYSGKGLEISTWGMLGTLTYEALTKYMVLSAGGELHTVLSEEIIIKGQTKAPNGFNWTQLLADWAMMG